MSPQLILKDSFVFKMDSELWDLELPLDKSCNLDCPLAFFRPCSFLERLQSDNVVAIYVSDIQLTMEMASEVW